MKKLIRLYTGVATILLLQMAYAENTTMEGDVKSVVNEESGSYINNNEESSNIVKIQKETIEKIDFETKKIIAKAELKRVKVIAEANKNKDTSSNEAIRLKLIAEIEANRNATIEVAKEKANDKIDEVNKKAEERKQQAEDTYNKVIILANEQAQLVLGDIKEPVESNTEITDTNMSLQEKINTILRKKKIYFKTGTQFLTNRSKSIVKDIANVLKANTYDYIAIDGYTDSDGSSKLNKKLSLDRVENVKKVLIEEGINADNIIVQGHGEEHPLVLNTTKKNKAKNRRIEFKVVK